MDAAALPCGDDNQSMTPAAMLTVSDVARLLSCSGRTVYRLADCGRMPRPVRLGNMVRWPRKTIDAWIENGCPRPRKEVK